MRSIWSVDKPFNRDELSVSRAAPIVLNDTALLFGFGDGFICVSVVDGHSLWTRSLNLEAARGGEPWWSSGEILIQDNKIFAIASGWVVCCLSATDGTLLWRFDLEQSNRFGKGFSKASTSDDAIFVSTQNTHEVLAISKANGALKWRVPGAVPSTPQENLAQCDQGMPTFSGGEVFVGSRVWPAQTGMIEDGGLVIYDAANGNLLHSEVLPKPTSSIAYANWNLLTTNAIETNGVAVEGGVILQNGYSVIRVDLNGKILWQSVPTVDGGVSPYQWQPYLYRGLLYGYNNGNGFALSYCLDPASGAVIWRHRLARGNESHTILNFSPCFSDSVIYKVMDDYWLFGQNIYTGSATWASNIYPYLLVTNNDDPISGSITVIKSRIYFVTHDKIRCMELVR